MQVLKIIRLTVLIDSVRLATLIKLYGQAFYGQDLYRGMRAGDKRNKGKLWCMCSIIASSS